MNLFYSATLRVLFVIALALSLLACATVQDQKREDKARFQIADTNVRLGLGYLQRGREEAALEKLQKAVDAMPEYAEAHSSIALVFERLDQNDKAGEHYQRAVELKPKDGSIQNNYAVFLCGQGEFAQAEKHFLNAINNRRYRTPAQAMENLGVCMLRIPDWEKAETYLRKALRMDPKLPGALLQMARVSVEKKKLMSGRAYLQRYQEVAPLGPEGLWLGIQVEEKLGSKEAAQEYKTLLRQKYSNSNEMSLLLEAEERERRGAAAK